GKPGGGGPRPHAAPPARRHYGLGQIGGAQRDDPVASLQIRAAPRASDTRRSEDARALGLSAHSASSDAGRHGHEAGSQRARLVRRGNGSPLQADELAGGAQSFGLQPQGG